MCLCVCEEDLGCEFLEFQGTSSRSLPADNPLIPAFTFLPTTGNGKAGITPRTPALIVCHPVTAQSLMKDTRMVGTSLFSFPGSAEVPEQPSRGRFSAAGTEYGDKEALRGGLRACSRHQTWRGASAPLWRCLCIFLLPLKQLIPAGS